MEKAKPLFTVIDDFESVAPICKSSVSRDQALCSPTRNPLSNCEQCQLLENQAIIIKKFR